MGRKVSAVPTRARASRKPNKASAAICGSMRIAVKTAEKPHGEGGEAHQDPRQGDEQHHKESRQPRHGAEARILDRRHDLKQADEYTDDKQGYEQRHGHPQRRQQGLLDGFNRQLWIHGVTKLFTSDPTTRFQPSTSTNRRILNGAEIITGGNWIMPIESVTDATTRSMTRNGKYRTAPIWKPVRSSEMI